jgi:large repetitive protein
VLDRAADLPGIAWWAGQGLGTGQLAAGFAASAEFHQRYDGMSDAAFVQALYANSELAAGAAGGAAAWIAYLGQHTRAELIGTWIAQDAVLAAQLE